MTATCPQCGTDDLTPAQHYCYHCGVTLVHPTVPRTANIVGDGALPASLSAFEASAATPFSRGAPHLAPPFSTAVLRSSLQVLVPILIGIGALAFLMVGMHHPHMHDFMNHAEQMWWSRPGGAPDEARPGEVLSHLLPVLFFALLFFGRGGFGGSRVRRARRLARRAARDARRGVTWL